MLRLSGQEGSVCVKCERRLYGFNSLRLAYKFQSHNISLHVLWEYKKRGRESDGWREKESKPPLYPVKDLALISAFQFSSITCSCFSLYVLHVFSLMFCMIFYFISLK